MSDRYGLVWQAVDAVKAATTTPDSEAGPNAPVSLKEVVSRNRSLLANAKYELDYEQNECLKESKRAQMAAMRYLKTNNRDLALLQAERAASYKAQILRIERAKNTILANAQTVSEFSTMTVIAQVMTSISLTMNEVSKRGMSGANLKMIAAQLERQTDSFEVQREVMDDAVRGNAAPPSESAESVLRAWEMDMVARAPDAPRGGGGGGQNESPISAFSSGVALASGK